MSARGADKKQVEKKAAEGTIINGNSGSSSSGGDSSNSSSNSDGNCGTDGSSVLAAMAMAEAMVSVAMGVTASFSRAASQGCRAVASLLLPLLRLLLLLLRAAQNLLDAFIT